MRTIPMTFSTALRTYECQFLGSRNVSTSSSQILADMEGPEITHHSRLPMARCDAADTIDESGQASYRHATESIDCASDGRHR